MARKPNDETAGRGFGLARFNIAESASQEFSWPIKKRNWGGAQIIRPMARHGYGTPSTYYRHRHGSPAQSNCRRLIDFLELEHLRHAGVENGSLLAPYTQLVRFGITRRLIAEAIREAEARGLIQLERGGKKGTVMTELSRYRLTYQWTKTRKSGHWDWLEPSDDWKRYAKPEIGPTPGTGTVPLREPAPAPLRELPPSQVTEIAKGHVVPLRELPSISWGGGRH